jgi:hypothetical protein
MRRVSKLSLLAAAVAAGVARAQPAPSPQPAAALERVREALKLCREEVDRYAKAGGPRGGARDPRLRWSTTFWELRSQLVGFPAAGDAARESVRLLAEAGRADEALARVQSLPSNDSSWRAGMLTVLRDVALQKQEPSLFLRKAEALVAETTDPDLLARLHYSVGRFHRTNQDRAAATAAFEAAIAAGPASDYGKRSRREMHDLRSLNLGQPAPAFSVRSLAGRQITNASLLGHATVFVYWASW